MLKGSRPIIAFVQKNIDADDAQKKFINEVQDWQGGLFRSAFDDAESLKREVTLAIHEWQLSNVKGPLDPNQLHQIAVESLIQERGQRSGKLSFLISIVGGPLQQILRPSEIEKEVLAESLLKEALFGDQKIFSHAAGSTWGLEEDSLTLQQDARSRVIKLTPQGGVIFRVTLRETRFGNVAIQEDVKEHFIGIIKYCSWLLDKIDPTQKLTHAAIAASFSQSTSLVIRRR